MFHSNKISNFIKIFLVITLCTMFAESRARNSIQSIQSKEQYCKKEMPSAGRSLSGSLLPLPENGNHTIFFEDFESGPGDWTHGDICETNGLQWHCSTFNAYSGQSWWCGNAKMGGYLSHWYQVLTTPLIDLNRSISPKLTFMHCYAIEYDETEPPEESPWDGCHVRISKDGGETYQLITPQGGYDPPDSLWVWEYHKEHTDNGMPGWHGFSNDWEKVTFDLSPFTGNQIRLKFIFASDHTWDVLDEDKLLGWFIDEIKIKDGSNLLYYDDAEDTVVPSGLNVTEGSGLYPQGWKNTTDTYQSWNHSWNCGDDFNMSNALTSPWISLPQTTNTLLLSYWVYADMPDFNGDEDDYLEDYYCVEVSTDELLWEKLIHDYARSSIGSDKGWVEIFSGNIYNGTLCLDDYQGKDVKIRWLVYSDDNDDGGNGSGFYLDDVHIYSEIIPFGDRQVISTDCDGARFVHACDLDDDGDIDVISASADDDKIAWYANNGDGQFGDQKIISTSVNHPMVALPADLDSDGDLDFLSGSHVTYSGMAVSSSPGALVWIRNEGNSIFSEPINIADSVYYPKTMGVADLNGDGDLDVLCGSDREITWYENNGSGGFEAENEIMSPVDGAGDLETADMNGDGDMDIIYARYLTDENRVYWFENEGGGRFKFFHSISCADYTPIDISVVDLDKDGDLDILAVNNIYNDDDQLVWYENQDGLGYEWDRAVISTALDGARSVFAADLNGDGSPDALTASENDNEIAWYENDGSGGFGARKIITSETEGAISVFAADLDGDGDKDVLSASNEDNTVSWFENLINSAEVDFNTKENSVPGSFHLAQNFPNPFNPETTIHYFLDNAGHVKVDIFNNVGQKISTLINAYHKAGHYRIIFDGSNLASGLYLYRIKTASCTQIRKMVLMK
ncbi:VCBS repeat-containing protein [bacterium]|nr:VCBS repeat-containing protein [bacterium]